MFLYIITNDCIAVLDFATLQVMKSKNYHCSNGS